MESVNFAVFMFINTRANLHKLPVIKPTASEDDWNRVENYSLSATAKAISLFWAPVELPD